MRRPLFFGLLGRYRVASLPTLSLTVAQPLTYMNRSGEVLPELLRKFRLHPRNLLVVTDNLDLPPGAVRLKRRGGAGSHNGLKSIATAVETSDFARLYLGIGHPGEAEGVVEYVLGQPDRGDAEAIGAAVERAAETLLRLPQIGFDQAMNELNRRE